MAKKEFIEALSAMHEPERADQHARQALTAALDASEELALAHADALLKRRTQSGQFTRYIFGCGVAIDHNPEKLGHTITSNFDYLHLPTPWRALDPEEQEYNWQPLDRWCEWAFRHRLPVVAGPVVSFCPSVTPDWLFIWEHDYDTVRDRLYEHIERLVTRYRNVVSLWNVVSGIHVNRHFSFNFEQLMDLTRMAIMLVSSMRLEACEDRAGRMSGRDSSACRGSKGPTKSLLSRSEGLVARRASVVS